MVSWKLAKVSKALATAVMIGTFLPTSIALASEAEDEKAAVSATSSSETEDKKVEASAASSPETEDKKAEVQPTSSSETETENENLILPETIATDPRTSAFALLDHFVTAERIPTSRWDTPANVTVITAKEIADNHYQSIAEAVNHVNGVFALMDGIALNGTNRTLILVDGRRTNVTPSMKAISALK